MTKQKFTSGQSSSAHVWAVIDSTAPEKVYEIITTLIQKFENFESMTNEFSCELTGNWYNLDTKV